MQWVPPPFWCYNSKSIKVALTLILERTIYYQTFCLICTCQIVNARNKLHSYYCLRLDGLEVAFLSSHARGQQFEPQSRQYLFTLTEFGLASTPVESLPNLNPAFLLSASRPFNFWPSVWFGSLSPFTAKWQAPEQLNLVFLADKLDEQHRFS